MPRLAFLRPGVATFIAMTCLAPVAAAAQDGDYAKLDPADFPALQHVCTSCHTTQRILHVHSWTEWLAVFDTMSGYGAKGTDADWDHVANFLQTYVTAININTAPVDEIGPVLQVSDDVAAAIAARREQKKFADLADLKSMTGISAARLDQIKSRVSF